MKVSVIVPAYNACQTIERTLEALADQILDVPVEVIVVDDGSSDETARVARDSRCEARVITQPKSGPAAARNRGAEAARGEVLAFTDADCYPWPDWLANGLRALDGAALLQGAVEPDPQAERQPFDRTVTVRREYGLYEAANLFVTRDAFERVGGFEDWLGARVGKQLAEDVWLGWRIRRAGLGTRFSIATGVTHEVFRRSALDYVAERIRLTYFADLADKVPELRETMFHRRWFLTRHTARFDLALVGGALVALAGANRDSDRRAAALPLLLGLPYAHDLWRQAAPWGKELRRRS